MDLEPNTEFGSNSLEQVLATVLGLASRTSVPQILPPQKMQNGAIVHTDSVRMKGYKILKP